MLQLPLSCPLNKGSGESSGASPPVSWQPAGGGLQHLHPNPAGVGSSPHAPASGWLRGSPPLQLGTLGQDSNQDGADE